MTTLGQRLCRAALFVVFALVLGLGAWIGNNLWGRTPEPAPLYSLSDLPPLPMPEDNGWMVFADTTAGQDIPSVPEPFRAAFKQDADSTQTWKTAVSNQSVISRFCQLPEVRPWAHRLSTAIKKPRFVDACEPIPQAHCLSDAIFRSHVVLILDTLDKIQGGQWEEAFATGNHMLRADACWLETARSTESQVHAMASARQTLLFVEMLLTGWQTAKAGANEHIEASILKNLLEGIDAMLASNTDPVRGLVTKYLIQLHVLRPLMLSAGSSLLFDPGETLLILNAHTKKIEAFAKDPSAGELPPEWEPRQSLLWWWHNPSGKLMLELLPTSIPTMSVRISEAKAPLLQQARSLSTKLKSVPVKEAP